MLADQLLKLLVALVVHLLVLDRSQVPAPAIRVPVPTRLPPALTDDRRHHGNRKETMG